VFRAADSATIAVVATSRTQDERTRRSDERGAGEKAIRGVLRHVGRLAALAAIAALAASPSPARADCSRAAADGNARQAQPGDPTTAGCGDATTVASATTGASASGTSGAAAARDDGMRELQLAQQRLTEAEQATDDAGRRAKYQDAKDHAERAIELLPDSADAHFAHFAAAGRLAQLQGLGTAAFQLMSLNKELDEVLRLDPNHANALAARGGMLVKLPRLLGGNTKRGIEYLERAVSLDSTAVGKRLELAEAYHLVGRGEDASRTADAALAMAETMQDPGKIDTCKRFIAELKATCDGCSMASIGR